MKMKSKLKVGDEIQRKRVIISGVTRLEAKRTILH